MLVFTTLTRYATLHPNMTVEKKPRQIPHLDSSASEQQEMDYSDTLSRLVDDLFANEQILPLLEQADHNPAIKSLVAEWKQALVHDLENASRSMVIYAAAGLTNILENGGLTEEELAQWRERDLWQKPFVISSLCRADLREHLSDSEIAKLTDSDMEIIADKMSDAHRDAGAYWESMEIMARSVLNTPQEE